MTLDPRVLDAQNKVEAKRAQLMTSVKYGVGEAKRRLAPDLVADQVWEATKDKIERGAHDAMLTAKNKPWLVGGIGAAIGLFLARGVLGDAVRGGLDKFADWRSDDDEAETTPVAAKPRPDESPETPVAVARQANKRKAGAAAAKRAPRETKTEEGK